MIIGQRVSFSPRSEAAPATCRPSKIWKSAAKARNLTANAIAAALPGSSRST
ncbi:hypothetical protein D3C83_241890 [compost metagenome]